MTNESYQDDKQYGGTSLTKNIFMCISLDMSKKADQDNKAKRVEKQKSILQAWLDNEETHKVLQQFSTPAAGRRREEGETLADYVRWAASKNGMKGEAGLNSLVQSCSNIFHTAKTRQGL